MRGIGNPVACVIEKQLLLLYEESFGGHQAAWVGYRFVSEAGVWGEERYLHHGILDLGHLPRGQPIHLSGDVYLLPLYR